MRSFVEILERAATRKGGMKALRARLPTDIRPPEELAEIPDHRYLAGMTKTIFQAGFVWKVIEKKWLGFEDAFWGFDIDRCMYFSPEDEDDLCRDIRIVRNRQKILTVPHNAMMIAGIRNEYGSFGRFIADWPGQDYIGLLAFLKKNGARLGGNSSQYFLRSIGKDGFVLSRDGVHALIEAGVIDKPPTSKTALSKVQQAYNLWADESGYGLADISRILALSTDAPDS